MKRKGAQRNGLHKERDKAMIELTLHSVLVIKMDQLVNSLVIWYVIQLVQYI